ncbi:hypothetical protein OAE73_00915 [bacterium]|nr:hypothetical protein [bacterium]
MKYQEAIEKSLNVKWKVDVCSQGEQCWCRVIKCEEPIFFKENDDSDDEEYYVVNSGELNKETVEHFVSLHNKTFNTNER